MIPLEGFWPDADDYAPGVIKECSALVPTVRGYAGAPSLANTTADTLANTCLGAAIVTKLDGTTRTFAGTTTSVYELASGTTWNDVSRTAVYTLSSSNRWRFTQFGNTSIAANGVTTLQSSSSGIFQDISGAPIASCIDAVNGFVIVGNLSDFADKWKCSAIRDSTDWTEAVATQCVSGRLLDQPGAITAVRRLGANVVIYKAKAIYVGTYVGAPVVWSMLQIPGEIGTPTQEAVVNIGAQHIFVGPTDFYAFDGSRPVSIGAGIKEWFFADLNTLYASNIIGAHNPLDTQVWFFYPSTSSSTGAIDSAVVFNYKTQKWGRAAFSVEAIFDYSSGAVTYTTLGNYFSTYDSINVSYDSPFFAESSPVMAAFNTSHVVKTITGDSTSSSLTLSKVGDDNAFSTLVRVRPRFLVAPTTATMTNYYVNTADDTMTTGATSTMTNGKIDLLRSARWHKVKLNFTGPVEMTGIDIVLEKDGEE